MTRFPHSMPGISLPGFLKISFVITTIMMVNSLSAQKVGINTHTPKAGLEVLSDDGILACGTFGLGFVQDSGYGTRLMWIPRKGAFRAGRLFHESLPLFEDYWDPSNIGDYSFTTGLNNMASGFASFSHGENNIASGDHAAALGGLYNKASGKGSFATGFSANALSAYEFSIGHFPTLYTPADDEAFGLTDRIFNVGVGTDNANRKDALTILKNGNIGINENLPESALHINGLTTIDAHRVSVINTGKSIMIGQDAGLMDDLSDNKSVYIGYEAGRSNVNGSNNIAIGASALDGAIESNSNIAIGENVLGDPALSGSINIGIGNASLEKNVDGNYNIAVGDGTLRHMTSGNSNVAIGNAAADELTSGSHNVALGLDALGSLGSGNSNVAIGTNSLRNSNGNNNTAIGTNSGLIALGSGNIFLGQNAGVFATGDNKLYIDNSSTTFPLIFGDFDKNKLTINDSLVSKYFQMTNGAGANKILQSNAAGHGTWVDPSTLFSDNWLDDGDNISNVNLNNVGIGIATPLEKLHVNGNLRVDGRISVYNTGKSVLIGENAGLMDDYSNNKSVFIGYEAGKSNVNGNNNIAIGSSALDEASGSNYNIAIGEDVLGFAGMSGNANIGIGNFALSDNLTGQNNVGIGQDAIRHLNTGSGNVAIGLGAGNNITSGSYNIALGQDALGILTTGRYNTAVGWFAMKEATGEHNTALGAGAGFYAEGNGNIFIGRNSGYYASGHNKLYIDNSGSTTPLIFGDFENRKLTINDSLSSKYFQMKNGAGSNKILQSNAAGHGTWVDPSTIFSDYWAASGDNISNTNTANVGIGTTTPSEKLHVSGNLQVDGRIPVSHLGKGVMIGQDAGLSDDLTDNKSIFIGHEAGRSNVGGTNNIAMGANALDESTNSNYNIAIGENVMGSAAMSGNINIGIGSFSLENNTTGMNNVGIGQNALGQNTGGMDNIAIGIASADAITNGSRNVAIGMDALGSITDQIENVAVGWQAMKETLGSYNTALGTFAGSFSSGSGNIFIGKSAGAFASGDNMLIIDNSSTTIPLIQGDFANNKLIINDSLTSKYFQMTNGAGANKVLQSNAAGHGTWVDPSTIFSDDWAASGNNISNTNISNVGIGITTPLEKLHVSGNLRVDGRIPINNTGNSVMIGHNAGANDDLSTNRNVFVGDEAGQNNITGEQNVAVGSGALRTTSSGNNNVAVGRSALASVTTGFTNTAIGSFAGDLITTGSHNTSLGYESLGSISNMSNNTAIGSKSLQFATGSGNTALGIEAGATATGSNNIFLGANAGHNSTASNKLYIDITSTETPLIHGDFTTNKLTVNDSLSVTKGLAVGTSSTTSTFEVNGSVATKINSNLSAGTINPDGTATIWRYASGTGTITLPAASSCPNRTYVIINQTGGSRTISAYHDLTTATQTSVANSTSLWIVSDGVDWWQIR